MKNYLKLFLTFFKIGLFTFGGGYAMIPLLENEFVERKKWMKHEEFLDIVAIAESTPGPIAINSATYIGFKSFGFFGSIFATLGVVLPSFIIIFTISLFFDAFLKFKLVAAAFRGIQACVVYLILSAGIKMFKKMKKNALSVTLTFLTVFMIILLSLFAVKLSSVLYILAGAVVGFCAFAITVITKKEDKK